jgi:hypothetical protein
MVAFARLGCEALPPIWPASTSSAGEVVLQRYAQFAFKFELSLFAIWHFAIEKLEKAGPR